MVCNMCSTKPMAVNHQSGREVVELCPELKHALHAALAAAGISLKEWLVKNARDFVERHRQPGFAFARSSGLARRES
jgi:hypothetical protein